MTSTLIIGDRGLPLTAATLAVTALEVLRAKSAGSKVVTFEDEGGVAAIVRYVAAETSTDVSLIAVPKHANGKRDYASLVHQLELGDAQVVFVGDPAICSLWTALSTLPDNRVALAIHA